MIWFLENGTLWRSYTAKNHYVTLANCKALIYYQKNELIKLDKMKLKNFHYLY